MSRQKIIKNLDSHIPFFRDKWTKFCTKVEAYTKELYRLEHEAGERYEKESTSDEFKQWVKAQITPYEKKSLKANKAYDLALKKAKKRKRSTTRLSAGFILHGRACRRNSCSRGNCLPT